LALIPLLCLNLPLTGKGEEHSKHTQDSARILGLNYEEIVDYNCAFLAKHEQWWLWGINPNTSMIDPGGEKGLK
jgi:hypothetical protein